MAIRDAIPEIELYSGTSTITTCKVDANKITFGRSLSNAVCICDHFKIFDVQF